MELRSKSDGLNQESIAEALYEQVRSLVPGGLEEELTLDTSLLELGLDSLTRMEVVNRMEEKFSIRFTEESLYDMETCRDLVDCIADLMDLPVAGKKPAAKTSTSTPSAEEPPKEITPDACDVTQFSEVVGLEQRLAAAAAAGIDSPFFRVKDKVDGSVATIDGTGTVTYTSFDYLGMATDPRVAAAAKDAIERFGTSSNASRLVGGDTTVLKELDDAIARFLGTEAAAVFPSGFGTNASLLGHLFGDEDLILYDELAHNSIVQGSLLSDAGKRPFPHNDFEFLDKLLADVRGKYRRVVIAMEGVYSMDGDFPDLPRFIEVKKRHQALLYVDEAHSIGVMGASGRGMCEHFGVDPADGDFWMGTISKALGSGGGYIAGRSSLIQYLKYTTPAFVFATACSPANAAAALAAVRLAEQEPERVAQLRDRSRLFARLATEAGFDIGTSKDTPVIPVILGDSMKCVNISHELLRQGIDAQPILFPAVPEKASRIRFFITANHTEEQIHRTIQALSECIGAVA
jgi:8-amino-7-oxononanoate synthase